MPSRQLVETVRKGFFVERTDETDADRNVICRTLRCKLVQEPHTLLRKRERQRSFTRDWGNGRDRQTTQTTRLLLSQPLGETCDRRSFKYRSEGRFNLKERAQA